MRKVIETERKGEKGAGENSPLKRAKTVVEAGELEKLNNFILMFSGEALDIINSNRYLTTHFNFIAQFAKSIIGFNLEP